MTGDRPPRPGTEQAAGTRILDAVLAVLRSAGAELPLVTVSWAQSSTGAIARFDGTPAVLSGPEALALTHRLRAAHDAILVGIRTVLSDDPRLSVRLVHGAQPQPVILDSRLRFPPSAQLLARTDRKPWIFHATGEGTEQAAAAGGALVRRGARLFPVRRGGSGLDLREVLAVLRALDMKSIMVEGGAAVLRAFMDDGLAAQAVITVSSSRLGGVSGPGLPDLQSPLRERLGEDEVLWGLLRSGRARTS